MMLLAAAFAGPPCHRLLDGGDAVLRTDDGSIVTILGPIPTAIYPTFFLHTEKLNARIYLGIIIVIAGGSLQDTRGHRVGSNSIPVSSWHSWYPLIRR